MSGMQENTTYNVAELGKGFWAIEENGVRSFLIEGGEKSMLVDTCFGSGDIKGLAETLTSRPIFLVNTHTDMDHVGGNRFFNEVYMHPSEIESYQKKAGDIHISPVVDGHVFDLGGRMFEVIHFPGHTPGSIMLLDRKAKLLISGDSIGLAPIFMFGSGRSMDTYIKSVGNLSLKIGEIDEIYPSHGPCPVGTDIIAELMEGAKKLLDGQLKGGDPPMDLPCKLYSYLRAKFLY